MTVMHDHASTVTVAGIHYQVEYVGGDYVDPCCDDVVLVRRCAHVLTVEVGTCTRKTCLIIVCGEGDASDDGRTDVAIVLAGAIVAAALASGAEATIDVSPAGGR